MPCCINSANRTHWHTTGKPTRYRWRVFTNALKGPTREG
jgi:hypothetical protein